MGLTWKQAREIPPGLISRAPEVPKYKSVVEDFRYGFPDPIDHEKDAIGPPTIAGGLLSLDPTDYVGPQTLAKAGAALKGLLAGKAAIPALAAITTWHGTPHKFAPTAKNPLGEFDLSKIGTGEGAQAYGHGVYVAESPAVAQGYQRDITRQQMMQGKTPETDKIGNLPIEKYYEQIQRKADKMPIAKAELEYEKLAFLEDLMQQPMFDDALKRIDNDAIKPWAESIRSQYKPAGTLYKVDLPDEHLSRFLDWDKPLSQQTPEVQKAMQAAHDARTNQTGPIWNPLDLNQHGSQVIGPYGEGRLRDAGILGIRYLDQGSRGAGQGSSNFVVFQPDILRILERQ